ncbi:MAG: bL35 family ribosomal protein [Candidatus Gracilibacteria bacterium]
MPRKIGNTGKQRTHTGAKKRTSITGTGKVRMQKAAHSHRLNQKATRQKTMGTHQSVVDSTDIKRLKTLLWN